MNETINKVANYVKKRKKHLLFISLIIASALIVHYKLAFDYNKLYLHHDIIGFDYSTQNTFTDILINYKEIPLWSNHVFGGTPFWAQPQVPIVPQTILISLLYHDNISKAMNYNILFNVILGGIFMYYLLLRLKIKPQFAFISSLIYMFCGQGLSLTYGWFTRLITYQFVPLVFLFYYLALNDKKEIWVSIRDAALAGTFMGLQFMAGGLNFAFFMFFLLLTIPLVYLIGNNFKKRLIKTLIITFVFLAIFLGIFAIRGIPLIEFSEVSSKETGFTFDHMIGTKIKIENITDFFKFFVNAYHFTFPGSTNIGLIAFILLPFSFFKIKKRIVLNLWFLLLLSFLVCIGFKPLLYPFWKYLPGFAKLHKVVRAVFIVNFSEAVLAGFGASIFFNKLSKLTKSAKIKNLIYVVIIAAIIIELGFIENVVEKPGTEPSTWGREDFNPQIKENELMNYLGEQKGIFRINHFNQNTICGMVSNHVIHHKLEMLYGCYSLWIPEYFNVYLSVSYKDPAKLKGMLNTKYFFDSELINVSGIRLVKEFEPCDTCFEWSMDKGAIDGPYLYLNEKYLPRAYFVNNAVLIAGNKESVIQATYWLMLNPNFNPVDTVVVMHTGSLSSIDLNELLKYKVIFLTEGGINQADLYKLQQFSSKGGKIYPNILNNENQVNIEDLESTLKSFKREYSEVKEANIDYYSANKRIIKLDGEKGFLVLAEKFFMFEGWNPKINRKEKNIMRANGINSVVYLDGEKGELSFKYSPKSFRYGSIISLITLLIVVSYAIYIKRPKNENNINKPK